MSHVTHWIMPYESLIEQLHQRFGGEIIPPSGSGPEFSEDRDGLAVLDRPFPALKSSVDGVPLYIEISGDYLLRIHFQRPSIAKLTLRPRRYLDRLLILLGMEGKVKSGNPGFDRKFTTDTDSVAISRLLHVGEVQSIILWLIPFEFLQFHGGGIQFARNVASEKDVNYTRTEAAIISLRRLLDLAAASPRN